MSWLLMIKPEANSFKNYIWLIYSLRTVVMMSCLLMSLASRTGIPYASCLDSSFIKRTVLFRLRTFTSRASTKIIPRKKNVPDNVQYLFHSGMNRLHPRHLKIKVYQIKFQWKRIGPYYFFSFLIISISLLRIWAAIGAVGLSGHYDLSWELVEGLDWIG